VRFRRTAAAVAALVASAGLAGCRTNVGTAAVVNGHRITETDVNDYLTPDAQPVREQTSTGSIISVAPRSFVLSQLVEEQLWFAIITNLPAYRHFTTAQLDARLAADYGNKTPKSVAEGYGLRGYSTAFYQIVLRVLELGKLLQAEVQSGRDLTKIVRTLHFPVSVNPRYGTWDQAGLRFDATPALPSYLSLAPGQPS
jgi:hypothetical protein